MHTQTLRERTHRATVGLVAASVGLIAAGVAGVGGSLFVMMTFTTLGAGGWWGRKQLRGAPAVLGYELGWYAARLWVGALVAAVATAAVRGASPTELQAIGGIVGLAGVGNHVLRPVYLYGIGLARRIIP